MGARELPNAKSGECIPDNSVRLLRLVRWHLLQDFHECSLLLWSQGCSELRIGPLDKDIVKRVYGLLEQVKHMPESKVGTIPNLLNGLKDLKSSHIGL